METNETHIYCSCTVLGTVTDEAVPAYTDIVTIHIQPPYSHFTYSSAFEGLMSGIMEQETCYCWFVKLTL